MVSCCLLVAFTTKEDDKFEFAAPQRFDHVSTLRGFMFHQHSVISVGFEASSRCSVLHQLERSYHDLLRSIANCSAVMHIRVGLAQHKNVACHESFVRATSMLLAL